MDGQLVWNHEPTDQEIIAAVRKLEAKEVEHVKGLAAKAQELIQELQERAPEFEEEIRRLEEEERNRPPPEPTMDEKWAMLREHATNRLWTKHGREIMYNKYGYVPTAPSASNAQLADMSMDEFAQWFKKHNAQKSEA